MNYFLNYQLITLIFLLTFSCPTSETEKREENRHDLSHIVVGYVTSWNEKEWGKDFERAKQLTHINYAFANVVDSLVVPESEEDKKAFIQLNALKKVNPDLKILISIGGWTWSAGFSDAVKTSSSRDKFANSALGYMIRNSIDGIDLDWEYPGLPGNNNTHRPEDGENYVKVLTLIREKLDSVSSITQQEYLLTIAGGANKGYIEQVDMKRISEQLDFVNLMTYDFHGGWEGKTGHHANMMPSESDNNDYIYSMERAIKQYMEDGAPAEKIVIGVPFYGRWWKGVVPINNGLYQNAGNQYGTLNFNIIQDSLIRSKGYDVRWDSSSQAPYIWDHSDSLFVSFETIKSLRLKTEYIKEQGLKGIMFWRLTGDDGELTETIFNEFSHASEK
ncbi:MAG: glycoside hydrolase family 18 protein [Bacteroidota bacterium]